MSYNKVSVITGHTLFGLSHLVRLHLDHNRIEFIHPDAFHGMTSLRLVNLEGNHIQQLHPATFSTFSLIQQFPVSTIKHLHLADNLLTTLPKNLLKNMPQLENLFIYGNPWACDCRMNHILDWTTTHPGIVHYCMLNLMYCICCFHVALHFAIAFKNRYTSVLIRRILEVLQC